MKLFLVKRTDPADYNEWDAFVIRAESEEQARAIAARVQYDDGSWHDRCGDWAKAVIKEVTQEGEPGIILDSNIGA